MTEKLIFRCDISVTDDGNVHVKTSPGENLDLLDIAIARAYVGSIDRTTEAIKVLGVMGRL